jgi:hypothetical protein
MEWFPRTGLGKISFWVGICSFVLMYSQYWIAMALYDSGGVPSFAPLGLLVIVGMLGAGVCAVIARFKYQDKAVLLWPVLLIGAFALFMIVGEFLFPH